MHHVHVNVASRREMQEAPQIRMLQWSLATLLPKNRVATSARMRFYCCSALPWCGNVMRPSIFQQGTQQFPTGLLSKGPACCNRFVNQFRRIANGMAQNDVIMAKLNQLPRWPCDDWTASQMLYHIWKTLFCHNCCCHTSAATHQIHQEFIRNFHWGLHIQTPTGLDQVGFNCMFSKLQVHLSRAQSRRLLHEADCWQPSQALLPELDPNLLLLVQALGEPSQTIGMSHRNNGRACNAGKK